MQSEKLDVARLEALTNRIVHLRDAWYALDHLERAEAIFGHYLGEARAALRTELAFALGAYVGAVQTMLPPEPPPRGPLRAV